MKKLRSEKLRADFSFPNSGPITFLPPPLDSTLKVSSRESEGGVSGIGGAMGRSGEGDQGAMRRGEGGYRGGPFKRQLEVRRPPFKS